MVPKSILLHDLGFSKHSTNSAKRLLADDKERERKSLTPKRKKQRLTIDGVDYESGAFKKVSGCNLHLWANVYSKE